MRHLYIVLIATAASMAGCVGAPSTFSASSSLFEIDPTTEPLDQLEGDAWESAPVGCDGKLADESLTFRIASADDHLIAAVDETGEIVCVDTIESVQDELEDLGEAERADRLGDQFLLAVVLPGTQSMPLQTAPHVVRAVSPHDAMGGAALGDPHPQPNVNPHGG